MEENFFELMQLKAQQNELATLISFNEKTERFGLALTKEDAHQLMVHRNESLKNHQRVEFSTGILNQLIYTFCDSQYIIQENYLETLARLQDIFYEFKNEAADQLTDDELMTFMKEQFESVCSGDLDYLEGTCLERFSRAVRAGYEGYKESGGQGEYEKFDEEQRWDKEIYMEVLRDLFW